MSKNYKFNDDVNYLKIMTNSAREDLKAKEDD